MHHDTGDVVGSEAAGMPLDARELEPVRRLARLEHLPRRSRGDDAVGHADVLLLAEEVRRKMVLGDVAGLIEELAVHDASVPCRPARGQSGAASR